jgi:hypothetical protein
MILCSCCETRLGHSFPPCGCAEGYCPRCLLCEAHCQCQAVPLVVWAANSLPGRGSVAVIPDVVPRP